MPENIREGPHFQQNRRPYTVSATEEVGREITSKEFLILRSTVYIMTTESKRFWGPKTILSGNQAALQYGWLDTFSKIFLK